MTTTCKRQSALEFVGGGSDKLYVIQVHETVSTAGTEYRTVCYYGRRGSLLSATEKYKGASEAGANAQFSKMEKEKTSKGYTSMATSPGTAIRGMPSTAPVFGGAASTAPAMPAGSAAAAPVIGPLPMLASVLPESELEAMIRNPDSVFQRKYDGERAVISMRRSGIIRTNRDGKVKPLSAEVEVELKKLLALPDFRDELETVIDGEVMGDEFVAYDMLTLRDNDIRSRSFDERYADLELLLDSNLGLLAETAYSEAEKRAMLKRAQDEKWEGLMVRIGSSEYKAGRCKFIFKYKLWATCTCRVLTTNGATRSVQVALRDEADNEVFVGNVTVPVNQDVPEPDSLIEVRYLYAMDGGSLYQPTLLRPRDDVAECDLRSELRQAPPEKRKEEEPAI